MVHNIVKVVNIMHGQSTSHIDAGTSIAEMESETISIVIRFDASITGNELDSAVKLLNRQRQVGCGMARGERIVQG